MLRTDGVGPVWICCTRDGGSLGRGLTGAQVRSSQANRTYSGIAGAAAGFVRRKPSYMPIAFKPARKDVGAAPASFKPTYSAGGVIAEFPRVRNPRQVAFAAHHTPERATAPRDTQRDIWPRFFPFLLPVRLPVPLRLRFAPPAAALAVLAANKAAAGAPIPNPPEDSRPELQGSRHGTRIGKNAFCAVAFKVGLKVAGTGPATLRPALEITAQNPSFPDTNPAARSPIWGSVGFAGKYNFSIR